MFTIDRIYINTIILSKLHNNMPCCYKCFLVGKCYILMCFNSFNSWYYSHHANNCRKNYICAFYCSCFYKTFITIYYLNINISKQNLKFCCKLFTSYTHKLWSELPHLISKLFNSCTCCQSDNLYIIISSYYIKRLCSDRAC